jgi:GNAT superfamily N-acetyltransferase
MDVTCRPATDADLDVLAAVRVRSWRAAYAGIVPAAGLDALDPARIAARWRSRGPAGHHLAEVGGQVVGWLFVGPYRADGTDGGEPPPAGAGEVFAIYVLPEAWGRGAGRALLAYGLGELRRLGLLPALLWVFAANDRARRFYERAGFVPDGGTHDYEIAGATLPEVRYRHDG